MLILEYLVISESSEAIKDYYSYVKRTWNKGRGPPLAKNETI